MGAIRNRKSTIMVRHKVHTATDLKQRLHVFFSTLPWRYKKLNKTGDFCDQRCLIRELFRRVSEEDSRWGLLSERRLPPPSVHPDIFFGGNPRGNVV